jgi:hypothetical protein
MGDNRTTPQLIAMESLQKQLFNRAVALLGAWHLSQAIDPRTVQGTPASIVQQFFVALTIVCIGTNNYVASQY